MAPRVAFDPAAEAELAELYGYIRDKSGSAAIAEGYVRRIFDRCMRLGERPGQGTRRDDLRPGLRTVAFERRATIAFTVEDDGVIILRILYGGRDLTRLRTT